MGGWGLLVGWMMERQTTDDVKPFSHGAHTLVLGLMVRLVRRLVHRGWWVGMKKHQSVRWYRGSVGQRQVLAPSLPRCSTEGGRVPKRLQKPVDTIHPSEHRCSACCDCVKV